MMTFIFLKALQEGKDVMGYKVKRKGQASTNMLFLHKKMCIDAHFFVHSSFPGFVKSPKTVFFVIPVPHGVRGKLQPESRFSVPYSLLGFRRLSRTPIRDSPDGHLFARPSTESSVG